MGKQKLHLHSMIVHTASALAPLAAMAYIFYIIQVNILTFGQDTWYFLVYFCLIVIFLVAIPAILTGVFERNHIYTKWHSTHKVKLVLSLILVLGLVVEISILYQSGLANTLFSPHGVLIIFFNNIIVFFLGLYGFKITLGRQSMEKTSYTPDLHKNKPIDILVTAGINRKEEPKYLDLLTER